MPLSQIAVYILLFKPGNPPENPGKYFFTPPVFIKCSINRVLSAGDHYHIRCLIFKYSSRISSADKVSVLFEVQVKHGIGEKPFMIGIAPHFVCAMMRYLAGRLFSPSSALITLAINPHAFMISAFTIIK